LSFTSPKTWASGYIVLASDLNTYIRDNQNMTAPAIMTSQGDLLIASGANTPIRLAKSTTSTQYLANTGSSNAPAWNEVALATGVSGTLPVGNGGTGATTFTANGILVGNSTSAVAVTATMATKGHLMAGDGSGVPSMLAVGSNDYVLTADSGEATGVKWAAAASGGGETVTIERFETAFVTTATFNTGALSATPKLVIAIGYTQTGTERTIYTGWATGTGAAAQSAGLGGRSGDSTTAFSLRADADAIGGGDNNVSAGDIQTAWQNDLNVTVFSKGSGITLDWATADVSTHICKLVVIEAE
jgi:hypothetical protein